MVSSPELSGKKTAEYIDDIMSRITAGFLSFNIAIIMPAFAGILVWKAEFTQLRWYVSLIL